MSTPLTDTATDKQTEAIQEPSLVFKIDGYDYIFTMSKILKYTRVGDANLRVGNDWVIGGTTYENAAYDLISIDGTTNSISQQCQQDKGGTSSITSFQIALLDYNEIATQLISPGEVLTDILGREAYVYLGYKDTLYPQDYVLLFNGIIDEVESGGLVKLNVSNPEQKKRQEIFPIISTDTAEALDASETGIDLTSADNFLLPVNGIFDTYVKIDDEIIKYDSISTNTLSSCTRAQFGTIAATHDISTSASSWYRLRGNAIDLALYIMLSGPGTDYYKENIEIAIFGADDEGNSATNGVFFAGIDVETQWGLSVGDYISTDGSAYAANNFTLRTITSIDVTAGGSLVTVNGAALTLETNSPAVASFKSQYNILPDGLGLGAHQVDVAEFLRIKTLFSSSIPDMDFYLTDTTSAKDFIDRELLFPSNLFSIPKRGKISCGVVSPPLALATIPVLDASKVVKPESIRIKRSIGKYFYNTVVYKYNYDAVETSKPLTGYILVDEDSQAQIPVGTKAITFMSKGLRNDASTSSIISVNARRYLAKYKNAAEYMTINVFYGIGFNIDVGDVVLFGDENLNIPDSLTAQRGFAPRLFEVMDKKMDIFKGTVTLSIVDTSYLSSGRYGIISPSSIVGTGSTTSSIVITDSYSTTFPDIEKNKWEDLIGQNIYIHDDTYSTTYSTMLLGFDPSDNYKMLISPISGAPTAGMIVDVAFYPMTTVASDNRLLKNLFVYTNPSVAVTSGVSNVEFVVSSGDISKFTVGATIILHNVDWSSVSVEAKVSEINTNNVVVDRALGFTPSSSYVIELIGFLDRGNAYRFL